MTPLKARAKEVIYVAMVWFSRSLKYLKIRNARLTVLEGQKWEQKALGLKGQDNYVRLAGPSVLSALV